MEQAKGRASSTVGRPLRIPILRKSPICGAAENPFGARGFRRASPYLCCRRCRNTDRQAGSTPRASAGAPCHWCRSRRFRAPLLSRCACSRRAASLRLGQTRSNFVGPGLFPSLRSIRAAHDGSSLLCCHARVGRMAGSITPATAGKPGAAFGGRWSLPIRSGVISPMRLRSRFPVTLALRFQLGFPARWWKWRACK